MDYSPENAKEILGKVEFLLKSDDAPPDRLKKLWWSLLFLRARALTNGLRLLTGDKVYGGPFQGMDLTHEALAIYQSPMLLGCYEHELHPVFEKIIAGNYTRILNIGCSVGYYAVGLARRMPLATVEAFDTDPEARRKCADMARANGVEERVHISGQFNGNDFSRYADGKTLVLMDIEGGEKELLDPALYPALRTMDAIVELHDVLVPNLSQAISARFIPSHDVEIIRNQNFLPDVSGLLPPDYALDPFDHLLMGWESRDGPTPWGIFLAKRA